MSKSALTTSALITAAVTLCAAPALAQWGDERTGIIAVGGGLATPNSDALDSVADNGFAIAGYVAQSIAGPFGWRAEGSFSRYGVDSFFESSCEVDDSCSNPQLSQFGGGLQMGGFGAGATQPYLMFTAGVVNFDPGDGDSETDFGIAFGSGVNWAVTETWGIGVEFKLNGFWPDAEGLDTQWFTTTNGMLFFRF